MYPKTQFPPAGPDVGRSRSRALLGASWQPALLLAFAVLGGPLLGGQDVFPLLVLAGIYGIGVVGVSILAGLGGQLTLGHSVFMAMGAYASALCSIELGLPPLVGLLVGIACALLLALITSPILRLRGWYLVMATIALVYILQRVVVNLGDLTGGNNGRYGIPPFEIGGLVFRTEREYFVLVWLLVVVLFILGRNLSTSRFGRSFAAIGQDTVAAASVGVDVVRAKRVLWLLAAVPPAIAGSMFAHYSSYIAPSDFNFSVSLTLFAAVIIGGARSIFAGILMVTFLVTMPAYTTGALTVDLVEAAAMIVIYLASPDGLAGIAESARDWLRARRARVKEATNA